MQNRAIEIHDSELQNITFDGCDVVLHFRVYIHASEGRPAIDKGTGWTQGAILRFGNGRVEGSFSEESRAAYQGVYLLSDGTLTINGQISESLIPIPLQVDGDVQLELQRWGHVVRVFGSSAQLELLGEPEYVEEFSPLDTRT